MKQLLNLIVFSAFLSTLASCEGGWTSEDKDQFLQSCMQHQEGRKDGDRYCKCVLDQTSKVYPTINAMVENKDSIKLREALQHCF